MKERSRFAPRYDNVAVPSKDGKSAVPLMRVRVYSSEDTPAKALDRILSWLIKLYPNDEEAIRKDVAQVQRALGQGHDITWQLVKYGIMLGESTESERERRRKWKQLHLARKKRKCPYTAAEYDAAVEKVGLKQIHLAAALSVSRDTLRKWGRPIDYNERGENRP